MRWMGFSIGVPTPELIAAHYCGGVRGLRTPPPTVLVRHGLWSFNQQQQSSSNELRSKKGTSLRITHYSTDLSTVIVSPHLKPAIPKSASDSAYIASCSERGWVRRVNVLATRRWFLSLARACSGLYATRVRCVGEESQSASRIVWRTLIGVFILGFDGTRLTASSFFPAFHSVLFSRFDPLIVSEFGVEWE